MDSNEIGGVVRAVLSALGGVLVAKGIIDSETAVALAGGLATVVVAIWSVVNKRKTV